MEWQLVVQLVFLVVEEMEDQEVVVLVVALVQMFSKVMVIHHLQVLHKVLMVVLVLVLEEVLVEVEQLLQVEMRVLLMADQVVLEQQVQ